jgi:hypothetical protein
MNDPSKQLPWQKLVDRKASELIEHVAATYDWVKTHGKSDPTFFHDMAADQFQWLRELYERELPLAKMLDEADLTVELWCPDAHFSYPRLSVVSSTFAKLRKNVAHVTKAVAGVRDPQNGRPFHMPEEMELGFSSLIQSGTVRFGFSLPRPEDSLFNHDDPLYQAVASAVSAIKTVSFSLSEIDDEADFEKEVKLALTDPKLRDSALIAVRELAPSGRSHGIKGVSIAGAGVSLSDVKPLTKESRQTVRHLLATPVKRTEVITITGIVRETDLDDKRFEVRGIEDGFVTDLRCIYGPKVADPIASKWLNHKVEVTGRVERDASGRARLMKVAHLKLVDAPNDTQQQIEFDFPDENR